MYFTFGVRVQLDVALERFDGFVVARREVVRDAYGIPRAGDFGACRRLHFEQINGARHRRFNAVVVFQFVFAQADVIPRPCRVGALGDQVLKLGKRRPVVAFVIKRDAAFPVRSLRGRGKQHDP